MNKAMAMDGASILRTILLCVGMMLASAHARAAAGAEGAAGGGETMVEKAAAPASPMDRIRLGSQPDAAAASTQSSSPHEDYFGFSRILLGMAVVLALVFILRWAGRRMLSLPSSRGTGNAIRVLARTTLGPRQQLMLIQVGRRIVLAGNCGTQISPLCEITDAEEVAELLGQLKRGSASTGSFLPILGRAGNEYEVDEDEENESGTRLAARDPGASGTSELLNGLLNKVRSLSQRYHDSGSASEPAAPTWRPGEQ